MDSRIRKIRMDYWRDIIVACNTSGMLKKDWLQIHGINAKNFYRHQKELRELEMEKAGITSEDIPAGENHQEFFDVTTALASQTNTISTQKNPECGMAYQKMNQPEILIQVGAYNLYVGSNVTEATLTTVLKVINHA